MKRFIIGLVSLFVVLSFSGCGKKPIPHEKVSSENYMIDEYINKALFKDSKHSQVYRYNRSQLVSTSLGYKNIPKDFKNEIKFINKSLTAVCSNHKGKIVKTTHKNFKKFYLSNRIMKNAKACKVGEQELFAYTFSQPFTTRGAHPSNVYWNYDMALVKFNEKDHQEKVKREQEELALKKQRQLEKEKKYKEKVAILRKNCNAEFIHKEAVKACSGAIKKLYSTHKNCVAELSESVFKTYKCQDKSIFSKVKEKIKVLEAEQKRLIKKQEERQGQLSDTKLECTPYLIGAFAQEFCKHTKIAALGGNRKFNWNNCVRNTVKKRKKDLNCNKIKQ